MTLALWSLLGFAVWTVLLIASVASTRAVLVVSGYERANAFKPSSATPDAGYLQRAGRAHANCVENLPVFATLVVVGHLAGEASPSFGTLAAVVLGARLAQGVTHLLSISEVAVLVRFTFFVVQLVCYLAMAALIAV